MSTKITDIPVFIVTINPQKNDRRDRLANRLDYFGLSNVTFVVGYTADSELVKYYSYRTPSDNRVISCTINHMFCLRKFIESSENHALILEDDAIFKTTFLEDINKLLEEPIENLLLLGFTHGTDYHNELKPKIGLNPITHWTCGAIGYLITREYAIKALSLFDHPGINYLQADKNTSESLTIYSRGKYINPPLILEEGVSSLLGHNCNTHLEWFSNYCDLSEYLIPTEDEAVVSRFKKYIKK
jgi:GR25 family glycosyltransferase involved in LPS biosynthesis